MTAQNCSVPPSRTIPAATKSLSGRERARARAAGKAGAHPHGLSNALVAPAPPRPRSALATCCPKQRPRAKPSLFDYEITPEQLLTKSSNGDVEPVPFQQVFFGV